MNKNQNDSFASYIPKLAIAIPLAATAIFATIFLSNQDKKMIGARVNVPNAQTSTIPTTQLDKATQSAILDLVTSQVCNLPITNGEITAYIKNKNVFAILTTQQKKQFFELLGDCVYIWNNSDFSGTKTCGISYFLGLAQTLPSQSLSMLAPLMSQMTDKSTPISKDQITKALASCKKEDVKDTVFTLPKHVDFKKVSL